MKALQRSGLIAIIVLLTTLLVACGGTPKQGYTANTPNQNMNNNNTMNKQNPGTMTNATPMATAPIATATPMNNNNMTGGITITPNATGNKAAFIQTGKAVVNANTVDLLLTSKNFAIYYYKPDTMFTATCTGQCAQDWPPVLAPQGMMTVNSSTTLPKQLSVHQTPNGAQVFYDGHALYTYAADQQAAYATGRGQDMQWYLVGFQL